MSERVLYEYAVIRVVPCAENEEFFNAGVILFCKSKKFLDVRYLLREELLSAYKLNEYRSILECYLAAFKKIATGEKGSGPIGRMIPAERFRWLTATRSTMIQASKVHPGYSDDPGETLNSLFEKYILPQ